MERNALKGKQTPGTNIRWQQDYEINGFHWALVSDESQKERATINAYTVLFTSCDLDLGGRPMDEQPDLALYAEAHNVANQTGMWPLDMVQRIKEMEAVLSDIDPGDDWTITPDMNDGMAFCEISVKNIRAIRALLNKK